jgi:hypothetical protein
MSSAAFGGGHAESYSGERYREAIKNRMYNRHDNAHANVDFCYLF